MKLSYLWKCCFVRKMFSFRFPDSNYILAVILLLSASTCAIKINCDFVHQENCIINCYQCNVQQLIITRPNQTVTAINGQQQDDDATDDVVTLKIMDQIVTFLPSGLSQYFPYLTVFKIWSSELRSFTQADVRGMKHLTDLSLSGNHLETLDSNIFEYNQRLIKIDFTRNRLRHIGTNLLKPLKSLMFADFYQNDCISDGARYNFDSLQLKLREKCKPTRDMMIIEIESLSEEIESLKREVDKREKKIKICGEERGAHAQLDSLFPSILTGEINWSEE